MRDARHYDVFGKTPPPGSDYEFFVAAFEMDDANEMPALYVRSIPVGDDAPAELRRYADYWNPHLASREARSHASRIIMLRNAGVPEEKLAEPLDRAVREVLNLMRLAVDMAAMALEEEVQRTATSSSSQRSPAHIRVRAGAWLLNDCSPTKAARFLNRHKAPGPGITRDHVDRAVKRFKADLVGKPKHIADLEFQLTFNRLIALIRLRNQALIHPKLKAFRGADLVGKIEELSGLSKSLDEALDTLRLRGELLPFDFDSAGVREVHAV